GWRIEKHEFAWSDLICCNLGGWADCYVCKQFRLSSATLAERSCDVVDRSEQNQGIIPGRLKAAPPPEFGGFTIDGIDQQGPSADQRSGLNAALESMLQKPGPDAQPCPSRIGRKLAE